MLKDQDQSERHAIGERLRKARTYLGHTQEEVARKLEIHRPALTLMELGKQNIDAETLAKLCNLYKTPVNYILTGESENGWQIKAITENLCVNGKIPAEDRQEIEEYLQYLSWRSQKRKEGKS